MFLCGRVKTGHSSTGKTGHFWPLTETSKFYFVASSVRKSVCTFVRQLLGPHFKTCAWWRRRSRSAVTAAVSPSSLPQSSTGRFNAESIVMRSPV
jgi:hypothetical protein